MAQFLTLPKQQVFDINGDPVAGAKVYVYESGTTTLLPIYTDSTLSVQQANPVSADAYGTIPPIYLADDVTTCKVRVTSASGVEQYTVDNVALPGGAGGGGAAGDSLFELSASEAAANVVPVNFGYFPGDVRRYGATASGSAADATTNTTAFANAMAVAMKGGSVYVPGAELAYVLNSITLPAGRGLLIYGDGPNRTKIKHNGAGSLVNLGADGIQNAKLRDLYFEPSNTTGILWDFTGNYSAYGLSFENCELNIGTAVNAAVQMFVIAAGNTSAFQKHYFLTEHLKIFGGKDGIIVDGVNNVQAQGWANDHLFHNVRIQQCSGFGLKIEDSQCNEFRGSIENCGDGTTSYGLRLDGWANYNTFRGRLENGFLNMTAGDPSKKVYSNNASGGSNIIHIADLSATPTNPQDLANGGETTALGIRWSDLEKRESGTLRPFRSSTNEYWLRTHVLADYSILGASYGRFGARVDGLLSWGLGDDTGIWNINLAPIIAGGLAYLELDRPFGALRMFFDEGNSAPAALAGKTQVYCDTANGEALTAMKGDGSTYVLSAAGVTEGLITCKILGNVDDGSTLNLYWEKTGPKVTLRWGELRQTHSTPLGGIYALMDSSIGAPALPSALRPAIKQEFLVHMVDAGAVVVARAEVSTDGYVRFFAANGAVFGTAGAADSGTYGTACLTYSLTIGP